MFLKAQKTIGSTQGPLRGLLRGTLLLIATALSLALVSCSEEVLKDEGFQKVPYVELKEFSLGVNDSIEVAVFRHVELAYTGKVDSAGRVTLPMLGDIVVAGRGVTAVRDEIQQKYAKYFQDPQVILKVTDITSSKAFVAGEVNKPGVVTIKHNTKLSEALVMSGGFTTDANEESVIIIRRMPGDKPRGTTVDMNKVFSSGSDEEDLVLASMDIIYVPPKGLAVTSRYMSYISHVLSPIVTLESGIVLAPKVRDVFRGQSGGADVSITP